MTKKILQTLIIISCVFLITNIALAANPKCKEDKKGECMTGTACPDDKYTLVTGTDCTTDKVCCVKKDEAGTTGSQNTGLGFDKVPGVAKSAGYGTQEKTIDQIISTIISVVLSLLGVIFLILMIYGGYTWMTAQGDEQKVDKAKDIIRAAIIGIIVVVGAYALSIFIITRIWPSQ